MAKYGIIDMGTNSVRLMLAKTRNAEITYSEKHLEMTRLGQGVDETQVLSETSMQNTIDAVLEFKQKAREFGVETLKILATSAVRDAKNREAFIKRLKDRTGLIVEVISGDREAELGFIGVLAGLEHDGDILVVDIGGGSTEFIIGGNNIIHFAVSENVGAVRMTGKHIFSDVVTSSEKESLVKDIDSIIHNTIESVKKYHFSKIVGIGGTITTISAMKQKMTVYDSKKIHNSEITKTDIDEMLRALGMLNNEERKKILGLASKRADIIYAGITIMERILKDLGKEKIIVSDYDNLEGCLYKEILLKQSQDKALETGSINGLTRGAGKK